MPQELKTTESPGDNEANRKGMKFWEDLVGGKYNGANLPFDICDYINATWEDDG